MKRFLTAILVLSMVTMALSETYASVEGYTIGEALLTDKHHNFRMKAVSDGEIFLLTRNGQHVATLFLKEGVICRIEAMGFLSLTTREGRLFRFNDSMDSVEKVLNKRGLEFSKTDSSLHIKLNKGESLHIFFTIEPSLIDSFVLQKNGNLEFPSEAPDFR